MTGVELHWPHSQLSMISLFETKPCSAHGRAQLMFWSRASPFHHTNTQCRGGCAPHIRQWKRVWGQNPTTSAGGTPLLSKIVHGKKKSHMVQEALVRTINSSDIFFPCPFPQIIINLSSLAASIWRWRELVLPRKTSDFHL